MYTSNHIFMQFPTSCSYLPLTPWAYIADFLVDLRYSSRPGKGCLHCPDVSISPLGNIGAILAKTNLCYLYLFCPHLGLILSYIFILFLPLSVLNYISKSTEEQYQVSEISDAPPNPLDNWQWRLFPAAHPTWTIHGTIMKTRADGRLLGMLSWVDSRAPSLDAWRRPFRDPFLLCHWFLSTCCNLSWPCIGLSKGRGQQAACRHAAPNVPCMVRSIRTATYLR